MIAEHSVLVAIAKSWGLFYLIGLSVAVLIYTFWPANRERFKHAKNSIMNDEAGPWE